MDSVLFLKWRFFNEHDAASFLRYCSQCGGKAVFVDSGKRRRNANGKTIYEYAIFKCPGGHTWNKKVSEYKATEYCSRTGRDESPVSSNDHINETVDLKHCRDQGVRRIEILIEKADGRIRLDKLLARQVKGASRSQICKWILNGAIKLDNRPADRNTRIRSGETIYWDIYT
jgi:hypothetical protein